MGHKASGRKKIFQTKVEIGPPGWDGVTREAGKAQMEKVKVI